MDSQNRQAVGALSQQTAPPQPVEIQPTVRVMRLGKPPMPTIPTTPPLSKPADGLQFVLNNNLIFPDNFGEIFVGEVFSAYIGIVGTDTPIYDATLSVKLQTANATFDVIDQALSSTCPVSTSSLGNYADMANFHVTPVLSPAVTPGYAKILSMNQYLDVIVKYRLTELGSHTLRVIVNYAVDKNKNEMKILKKFYRFNVVEPLSISTTVTELANQYLVQYQVANRTKHLISLEKVREMSLELLRISNFLRCNLV